MSILKTTLIVKKLFESAVFYKGFKVLSFCLLLFLEPSFYHLGFSFLWFVSFFKFVIILELFKVLSPRILGMFVALIFRNLLLLFRSLASVSGLPRFPFLRYLILHF